jgi:hypothetical protein
MTKPYKLLTPEIVDKEKGILNNTFVRFIGPADSVFSMFIRSFGYRQLSPDKNLNFHKYEFIIYDKNPKHIAMFKHMLTWDGELDPSDDFKSFNDHIDQGKEILKLQGTSFPRNSTIGKASRHGFKDFKGLWTIFKNSKFTFVNVDVIYNNTRFCEMLYNLSNIKILYRQFVKLDFNKNNYENSDYTEAMNNILHLLWLKSFKEYQTVVELADDNNVSYEDFAGKLYSQLNPSFCILPWMHIQYKPSGQSKLCCRYDTVKEYKEYDNSLGSDTALNNLAELVPDRINLTIQKSSMENSFYSNYWKTARTYTENNQPISGCHKCYKEEQVPGEVATSMRLGSSILYNNGLLHKKPRFEKPKIEFLEVGFGNYCNLACLSCNSTLSTTWHDDEVQLNETSKLIKRDVFPKLDNLKFVPEQETLDSLNLIKFTGGEPMINPEFIKFIDLICEKGHPENVSLEIYTNCSYIPSPKLLENLVKFKSIQLNLSIDAYGSVNDYVRYGSTWQGDNKQTVSKAIDFWLEQGVNNAGLNIIMSTTLSILNVFELPKLMPWWMKKFKDSGNKVVVHRKGTLPTEYEGFFKLQMAFDPAYIDMNILPQEYYKDIEKWSDEYEANFTKEYPDLEFIPESISASLNKLKNTIKRSKGDPKNARLLLEYLAKMDKIRNNSADESIPEVITKVKEYLLTQDKLQ